MTSSEGVVEEFVIRKESEVGISAVPGGMPQGPDRREFSQLNLKLDDNGVTNDGKLFYVNNPQETFAVYPPLYGCGNGLFTAAESAKDRCLISTNGGFFETQGLKRCHGTIVSDGVKVNEMNETNVSFGITREGKIIVGYLSESEKNTYNFTQLINGVVWVVRNGKNFVSESIALEDMSIQETSHCTPEDCFFRTVKAGRVLLGHDNVGRILIMATNGHRGNAAGITLDEAASLMIKAGAVNAVNMDGGGSATVFSGNTLISSPSDDCGVSGFDVPVSHSCARNVSSILCIKPYPDPILSPHQHFRQIVSRREPLEALYVIAILVVVLVVFKMMRRSRT